MYEKRLRNLKNKINASAAVAAAVKGVYEVTTEDLKNKEKTLQFTNSKNLSRIPRMHFVVNVGRTDCTTVQYYWIPWRQFEFAGKIEFICK